MVIVCPKPNPIPMHINKYDISGSLIAVLNLIIERAPTKPRDKANEDFTIDIINAVVVAIR